jgi:hypothetical protein
MAKQTKGKRTANRAAIKRRSARRSAAMRTKAERAFPGGSRKTENELHQVVPRTTRS